MNRNDFIDACSRFEGKFNDNKTIFTATNKWKEFHNIYNEKTGKVEWKECNESEQFTVENYLGNKFGSGFRIDGQTQGMSTPFDTTFSDLIYNLEKYHFKRRKKLFEQLTLF